MQNNPVTQLTHTSKFTLCHVCLFRVSQMKINYSIWEYCTWCSVKIFNYKNNDSMYLADRTEFSLLCVSMSGQCKFHVRFHSILFKFPWVWVLSASARSVQVHSACVPAHIPSSAAFTSCQVSSHPGVPTRKGWQPFQCMVTILYRLRQCSTFRIYVTHKWRECSRKRIYCVPRDAQ